MFSSRFLFLVVICTLIGIGVSANQTFAITVDCFSCHDREAFNKRVKHEPAASGECLECHSPHVARFAGLLQKQLMNLCYSCHSDAEEEHSKGFVHLPVLRGQCQGCHTPHSSNQNGLLKDSAAELCFSCHDYLPRKYKNTHAPYAKGQCDSCHQPHQSDQIYLLKKEPVAMCLTCHSQATVENNHRNFPEKLTNCSSCHNPHGSDRPSLIRNVLHEPFADGCADCHVGKGIPVRIETCLECHPHVSDQMASSHNHLVRYENNGCIACHTPHAGDDQRLLKGRERQVCGTCHEATFERHDLSKHSHPTTDACNDCHAPHGSNHPSMVRGPINDVCNDCHGLHGTFTHPIGENVFDPRTGQLMTCSSCHAVKGTDFEYFTPFHRKKALCIQCHLEY